MSLLFFWSRVDLQEVFREPEYLALVQSQEGVICTVCFTPTHQRLPLILRHIQKAQKSIKVQAYSFTSKEIAEALLKAQRRGVIVTIIADKSQKTTVHSQVKDLKQKGIEV